MIDKPLVLIGLPGCRASEVADVLAARSGRQHPSTGETPPVTGLAELLARLAERPAAIAADVELLATPEARAALRADATTVWLDGDDTALTAGPNGDPSVDRAGRAELRHRWLGPLTVVADAIVSIGSDDRPELLADAVERRVAERSVATDLFVERVELDGGRGYPVVVGRGVIADLASYLPEGAKRVAIVTQAGIGVEVATGREQQVFVVEDGEGAKRLDEVGRLASAFAAWGLTRADCVVSVGGGVVSDLAGFVAASYHRGSR